jgi:GT2 family glycosyltransferase
VRALGLEHPYLWTQDPRAASLVERLPIDRIVYDLTDDWAAFETDDTRRTLVERRIASLARRAALVIACSKPLELAARSWSDQVHLVPNAVDGGQEPHSIPSDLEGVPRPRLGYAGTLHSARLDVDLLVRAAQLRPSWAFVFLGPNLLEPKDKSRLLTLPNVHYLGPRPHSAVRSYLEGLDVCLVPHLITDFTQSLDPLKLYEYLAAGRPIVATALGNSPDLQPHIALGTTAAQLVEQAEREIVTNSPARVAARRAVVAHATWSSRAATIEALLGVLPQDIPAFQVSIVIVSFNTRALLERCLAAVAAQTGIAVHTIVVDNASTDGSVAMVRNRFPEVEVLELDQNVGFARANNLAFEKCRGEYVLLLNPDAFLEPHALRQLVATARRHPRAGAVGPRLLNPDGTLQRSAWPFPAASRLLLEASGLHRLLRRVTRFGRLDAWPHDAERSVPFLIGACLLLRATALAEVNGFDEAFWLYGEEADLQRRLRTRGWSVVFTPSATATHVGAAASADMHARTRHFYTGQMRFLQKHGGRGSWPIARASLVVGSLLRGRLTAARIGAALGHRRHSSDTGVDIAIHLRNSPPSEDLGT